MTKREMFERLIDIVSETDVEDKDLIIEKLNKEIELVSKKRTGMTKTQKENEVLVEDVYNAIAEAGKPITVTDIYNAVKSDKITSAQKVAALVKKLVNANRVVRTQDKRSVYFTIAE